MQRGAQEGESDGATALDEVAEMHRVEVVDTRPAGDVGVVGHLRLHADEMLDEIRDGHLDSSEKELTLEESAIESALVEDVSDRAGGRWFGHAALLESVVELG